MTDPAPPSGDDPPRPLMSPAFWVMLGFCFLCVVGGVLVVLLGPWLTGPPHSGHGAHAPAPPAPAASPSKP